MYQQSYNYYPNLYQAPQKPVVPPQPTLKGRPVSSIDEVRATSVDFDGSISYFPDLANKRIYTKYINMDGTATVLMYELKEMPAATTQYITREEFEAVINQLKGTLQPPQSTAVQSTSTSNQTPINTEFKF